MGKSAIRTGGSGQPPQGDLTRIHGGIYALKAGDSEAVVTATRARAVALLNEINAALADDPTIGDHARGTAGAQPAGSGLHRRGALVPDRILDRVRGAPECNLEGSVAKVKYIGPFAEGVDLQVAGAWVRALPGRDDRGAGRGGGEPGRAGRRLGSGEGRAARQGQQVIS